MVGVFLVGIEFIGFVTKPMLFLKIDAQKECNA